MSWIKRLTVSIGSRMDELVGELENHDALIRVSIKEQKQRVATAKAQLARIQRSEQDAARQMAGLKANASQWAERALREAEGNNEKALQCMERRQAAQQQVEQLRIIRVEYQQTAARISADIANCEEALASMIRKHELMRARQSSVDAKAFIDQLGDYNHEPLQERFERWEMKLAQGEYALGMASDTDLLEQTYLDEEKKQYLQNELLQMQAERSAKEQHHDGQC